MYVVRLTLTTVHSKALKALLYVSTSTSLYSTVVKYRYCSSSCLGDERSFTIMCGVSLVENATSYRLGSIYVLYVDIENHHVVKNEPIANLLSSFSHSLPLFGSFI